MTFIILYFMQLCNKLRKSYWQNNGNWSERLLTWYFLGVIEGEQINITSLPPRSKADRSPNIIFILHKADIL